MRQLTLATISNNKADDIKFKTIPMRRHNSIAYLSWGVLRARVTTATLSKRLRCRHYRVVERRRASRGVALFAE